MKKIMLLFLFAIITSSLFAKREAFVPYYSHSQWMPASDGAFRYGSYGFINPATLAMTNRSESLLMINDKNKNFDKPDYGIFSGAKNFGMGFIRYNYSGKSFYDIRYSLGMGNRTFGLGYGYTAISGDNPRAYRPSYIIGMLYRPLPYISAGYIYRANFAGLHEEHFGELALRPIKNYPLTLFLDAASSNLDDYKKVNWSAGVNWEIVDGIRIGGRYFSDERLSLGFDISFGYIALGAVVSSPSTDDFSNSTNAYLVRFSPLDRSIIYDQFLRKKKVAKLELKGSLQPESSIISLVLPVLLSFYTTIYDVLNKLEALKNDPEIKEIYLNISDFTASYSDMWEIRQKLAEIKAAGKRLVIFSENFNIRNYHFATVADEIILEPMGEVSLEGFSSSRSYYKKFMEKYGIGFEEIRLFKYKSAAESFSRTEFSEGEKEQKEAFINDLFNFAKSDIMTTRNLSESDFNEILNSLIWIAPKAKEKKLVDRLHRWDKIDTLIKNSNKDYEISNEKIKFEDFTPNDNRWSEQDRKIALVYAEGVCDLETGISGRRLSKVLSSVLESDKYEGVILRVNSPGGSAFASDLVAEVTRRYKGKKPIIVSQGAVAASGGYWLSMDADKILATPITITGSIGVIASYIYNKGLFDSLGVTYDVVKRGPHSDLGSPITLPFIGIGLPARNFTNDELSQFKGLINDFYGDFVSKVAKGRNTDSSKIAELAQGRIYSGLRGKQIGLVDEIGGIDKAIELIKSEIKFKKNDVLKVDEFWPTSRLELKDIFEAKAKQNQINIFPKSIENDLKFRINNNGKILHILPADFYDLIK